MKGAMAVAFPPDFGDWDEYQRDLFIWRKRWLDLVEQRAIDLGWPTGDGCFPGTYLDESGYWHGQLPPPGDWGMWVLMAGRGYGKTRCASEDMGWYGLTHPGTQLLVVGPTYEKMINVDFEGESGLVKILPEKWVTHWHSSEKELLLTNGTIYRGISAETPDRIRGYAFARAWIDELGEMVLNGAEVLDQVELATRVPPDPRIIITTTPKPTRLMRDLRDEAVPPPPRVGVEIDTGPAVPGKARSLLSSSTIYSDCFVGF